MASPLEDIEALREKSLAEQDAFLSALMDDPLFDDVFKGLKPVTADFQKPINKSTKKRKNGDTIFKFTGRVPNEQRKSARLRKINSDITSDDLLEEKQKSDEDDDDVENLESVVYRVKRSRKSSFRSTPAKILPVEEVTEQMITNIKTHGTKVYGANGTSCHQCRQKTLDTKTVCRSGKCIGVRGQFCGICVINRYGEDPICALKDPNWNCYVCRGCCNCSFCRLKEGKRPTGILAPLAKANGYKSVMDFLRSLKGYGDYTQPHKNPENLLGFDGSDAIMGGKKRLEIKAIYDVDEFTKHVKI